MASQQKAVEKEEKNTIPWDPWERSKEGLSQTIIPATE